MQTCQNKDAPFESAKTIWRLEDVHGVEAEDEARLGKNL